MASVCQYAVFVLEIFHRRWVATPDDFSETQLVCADRWTSQFLLVKRLKPNQPVAVAKMMSMIIALAPNTRLPLSKPLPMRALTTPESPPPIMRRMTAALE